MLAMSAALAHVLTRRKITLHLINPQDYVMKMTICQRHMINCVSKRTHLKTLAVRARSGTKQGAECHIIKG